MAVYYNSSFKELNNVITEQNFNEGGGVTFSLKLKYYIKPLIALGFSISPFIISSEKTEKVEGTGYHQNNIYKVYTLLFSISASYIIGQFNNFKFAPGAGERYRILLRVLYRFD